MPDTGLISYGEMVDQAQQITRAVSIPVIGDGDNGYGNAMNVKRTVRGYIAAGFAGIILEDQVQANNSTVVIWLELKLLHLWLAFVCGGMINPMATLNSSMPIL